MSSAGIISEFTLFQYCFFKTCVDEKFHNARYIYNGNVRIEFLIDHDGVVVEIGKAEGWVRTSHSNV